MFRAIVTVVLTLLFMAEAKSATPVGEFSINRSASMIDVSRKNFVDTVAIDASLGGYLTFEAKVEGRILRLALDTGSSIGFFYGDLKTGDIPFDVTTTGVTLPVNDIHRVERQLPVVIAPPITIGGTTYSNYPMFVTPKESGDASSVLESYGIDAMIGFNFIRKGMSVKIDVRQGIMVITDRRGFFDREKASFRIIGEDGRVSSGAISFRYDGFLTPSVPVSISGFKFTPRFDTGSSRTLISMGETAYIRMATSSVYGNFARGITVSSDDSAPSGLGVYGESQVYRRRQLKVPTLNVSGLKLKNVSMQTVPSDGTIGLPFLDYTAVIIEPYNHRMTFEPYGGYDSFIADSRIMAMRLTETDVLVSPGGKIYPATQGMKADPYLKEDLLLRITSISKDSGLYEKGARSGDFLISVDGKKIHTVEDYESLDLGNNQFVFQSQDGTIKNIRTTPQDFYSE